MAADGDTVRVRAGTYPEGDLSFSGKGIHLVSEGGPRAVRIEPGVMVGGFDISDGEGPDTIVEGFTVRGA